MRSVPAGILRSANLSSVAILPHLSAKARQASAVPSISCSAHSALRPASVRSANNKQQRKSEQKLKRPIDDGANPSLAPAAIHSETQDRGLATDHIDRPANVTDGRWDFHDQEAVRKSTLLPKSPGASQALLGLSQKDLEGVAVSSGLQKFRGQQIYHNLLHGALSIQHLSSLPKDAKDKLSVSGYRTGRSIVRQVVEAPDGTCKFLLQLYDGRIIETVGIPETEGNRLTVCVSSQVGCAMRCTFCATGKGGFARNLLAHEIIDQVLVVQEHFKQRVSNVVFMGMGEPMLNISQVVQATVFLMEGVGIGARHITISTVGVPNSIMKLAGHKLQITLAVSLHAPNQKLREEIVPSARMYPLEAILLDCNAYFRATGRRITFEYILLSGVNDSQIQARELAGILHKYVPNSHVNLIPFNSVDDAKFVRPSRNAVMRFSGALREAGVKNSVRVTRGSEAAAACGQLRNKFQKSPLPDFAPLS